MKNALIFIVAIVIAGAAGFGLQQYLAEDTISDIDKNNSIIGQTRPEFAMMDIDGNIRNIKDWDGQVVLLNFWATWCPPCRAEMPSMQRAWEQLEKEGILMLGINVGEDEDTIFQFTANYPVEFPLLMDQDSRVINQWPVRGLPTTFVVSPEGKTTYRAIGGREWDDPDLLAMVRALMQ